MDAGGEMRSEPLLDVFDDRFLRALTVTLLSGGQLLHLNLEGTNRESLLDDETSELHAMGLILEPEQHLGMASGELTLTEVALNLPVK